MNAPNPGTLSNEDTAILNKYINKLPRDLMLQDLRGSEFLEMLI